MILLFIYILILIITNNLYTSQWQSLYSIDFFMSMGLFFDDFLFNATIK